jgi:16S rRNA C967 or C1407 C5-methylase (RsmB/RsmF family)
VQDCCCLTELPVSYLFNFLVFPLCSFTKTQNEGVVERFLTNQANAELKEVDPAKHWPCRPGDLPHTLRFDPVTSNTSGLFIAKIVKRVT